MQLGKCISTNCPSASDLLSCRFVMQMHWVTAPNQAAGEKNRAPSPGSRRNFAALCNDRHLLHSHRRGSFNSHIPYALAPIVWVDLSSEWLVCVRKQRKHTHKGIFRNPVPHDFLLRCGQAIYNTGHRLVYTPRSTAIIRKDIHDIIT